MPNRKIVSGVILSMLLMLSGCTGAQEAGADTGSRVQVQSAARQESEPVSGAKKEQAMKLTIDNTAVPVTWEQNASTAALQKLLPLTIELSPYGGFEQVGSIGHSLTRNDTQTTTQYGDIVLYSGDKIVIFYGSNSWSYTRLGHINLSQQEMTDLLSHGDVTIKITE